eukprot:COSAG02_NODE_8627_length_2501_cov_1.642798_1_plen_35_part_10
MTELSGECVAHARAWGVLGGYGGGSGWGQWTLGEG